jgi:shikimate kinase
MKNIIITGFMGTGKSSVGRRLAKELNMKFVDTDGLIEREAKMPISEIFAQFGEDQFRKLESKVISEVSACTGAVISTGGGAIINPLNLEALKRNGVIVCLAASVNAILSRIGKGNERPLLSVGNKEEIISNLLKAREPFYKKADFIIDTTEKGIGEVVGEIIRIVAKLPSSRAIK